MDKVFCPALKECVYFNSKGFYHLKYSGLGKTRPLKERISRLNLIYQAPYLLKTVENISEFREIKNIKYWELRKTISENEISIILRKEGKGRLYFYSIWKK